MLLIQKPLLSYGSIQENIRDLDIFQNSQPANKIKSMKQSKLPAMSTDRTEQLHYKDRKFKKKTITKCEYLTTIKNKFV